MQKEGGTKMTKQGNDLPKRQPILCIDFDGVLHSYSSGWKGARNIPDLPMPGAIEWLNSLIPVGDDVSGFDVATCHAFQVAIFSSRSRYLGGRRAIKKWLIKNGISSYQLEHIKFPLMKPPAFLLIDDRAFQFQGQFPSEKQMKEFKPYRNDNGKIKYGNSITFGESSVPETETVSLRTELIRFLIWHDNKFGSYGGDKIIAELIDEYLNHKKQNHENKMG